MLVKKNRRNFSVAYRSTQGGVFKMKNVLKVALVGTAISGILLAAPTAEAASYTVQKGDTLSKIAKAHKTTIQQLKQWNHLTEDQIYIEQTLIIASTTSNNKVTANSVIEEKKEPTSKGTTHKVVKGDNLTKIAKKYNTTIANLQKWNDLDNDAIKVGQTLAIHKDVSTIIVEEAPNASAVEADINFKQNADKVIEQQLNNENTLSNNPAATSEALYAQAIEIAKQAIGVPYKYGGNTLDGFDCSGFISYVYNTAGLEMKRKSSLQYFEQDTTKVESPVPGDVVFFKNTYIPTISHMGIYIGNDQFIHAGSKGIAISSVNEAYWAERFVAYKRLNSVK